MLPGLPASLRLLMLYTDTAVMLKSRSAWLRYKPVAADGEGMIKKIAMPMELSGFSEARLGYLQKRLVAFFRRGGSSMSDAEDLTQDVFARLARPVETQSERSDAYVFTVARNLHRDSLRRIQVRRKHGQPVEQDIFPLIHSGSDALDAERVLISKEEAERLVEGLAELTERTREIFLLYRIEGKSQRDIAAQLGLSVSAIEKNIARAMLHLVQKVGWER